VLAFDTTWFAGEVFWPIRRQAVLTVSISPVFDLAAHVDLLFTRAAHFEPLRGVQIFGGLKYAIFNDRCVVIDDDTFERNLGIPELPVALCMGGADAANKTLSVLRALAEMPEPMTIFVLLGEGYAHSYNLLVDAVRTNLRHEVILAKASRSMWRVLSQCALGIMAGGLTTVEAVYAGLPTLNLFEKPEHGAMLQELFDVGVCLNGGLISERSLQTAIHLLRRLNRDRDELRRMRQRTRGLADVHGPSRVLREIEQQLLHKALRSARRGSALEVAHA
jgi:spore coat polysaccharide biosynthesis predicted glycosyltransferase SpsG